MPGMFGLTPEELMMQQRADDEKRAIEYGKMDPFQRANTSMYQAGANLGRIGAGMLGGYRPEVRRAEQMQEIQKGMDLSSPEGLMEGAKRFSSLGMTEQALELVKAARELAFKQAQMKTEEARANKYAASGLSDDDQEEIKLWQADYPGSGASREEKEAWLAKMPRAIALKSGANVFPKMLQSTKDPYGESKSREQGKIDARTEAGIPLVKQGSGAKSTEKAEKAQEAKGVQIRMLDNMKRNIEKLIDPMTGKPIHKGFSDAFGPFNQYKPDVVMSQETQDARSVLDSLISQETMRGLTEAKKAVDQSFGSMQVKEWDKFTSLYTQIRSGLHNKNLSKKLKELYSYLDDIQRGLANAKPELRIQTDADLEEAEKSGSISPEEKRMIKSDPDFGKTKSSGNADFSGFSIKARR